MGSVSGSWYSRNYCQYCGSRVFDLHQFLQLLAALDPDDRVNDELQRVDDGYGGASQHHLLPCLCQQVVWRAIDGS